MRFNKLVRDRIPEIIAREGKELRTRVLEAEEFVEALLAKLVEEWEEFKSADGRHSKVEELADVAEVLDALETASPEEVHKEQVAQHRALIAAEAEQLGVDVDRVGMVQQEKARERGGFTQRIFLEEVVD